MWHDIPLWLTFLALSGAIFWCGLLGWFVWQPIAHLFEWGCDKDEGEVQVTFTFTNERK